MKTDKLTDADAKEVLRTWPGRTRELWRAPEQRGFWIRGQPKELAASAKTPTIDIPGATLFKTQPDGMWVYLDQRKFADIVCIEICGSSQNFNDKRSRYANTVRSLVLNCSVDWLKEKVSVQGGGTKTRWRAFSTLKKRPKYDIRWPVRWMRVLYALPEKLYGDFVRNNVPGGHEYFCRHSSLKSYTAPQMQQFLGQMSFASHFYGRPRAG